MKTSDLITMCLRNLARRKVRTLLTVIGVVVGTCAIVVMISIGIGMKASQDAMLAEMGDLTVIEIYNYGSSKDGKLLALTDEVMSQIQAMPNVVVATPFYQPNYLQANIYTGRNDRYQNYFYNVVGVYPEALPLLGYELIEGSFENALSEPYSIVMGQYAAYNFRDTKRKNNNRVDPYPDENGNIADPFFDPLTSKYVIQPENQGDAASSARKVEYKAAVTAILKEDWGRGYETSRGMFMNIADLKKMEEDYMKVNKIKASDDTGYTQAKVKVSDIQYVGEIEQAIQDMGFETYSMETIRKPMEEQANKQQMILGSLGAISLFVAAIGITNTMVMSIYERTREIGIMKVVGCFVRDIRTIFLMEAGAIGFLGGVIGIALSYFLSFLMNYFGLSFSMSSDIYGMGAQGAGTAVSIIPLWLVGAALVFSTCVGLLSGFYPANRAVKISALTAIKQD